MVISQQIDERNLKLYLQNGYTTDELLKYFEDGAFAFTLYEPHDTAGHEEDDIDPKNGHLTHSCGKSSSRLGDIQAQNFARFTFGDDFERPATNLAIGREPL